MIHLPALGEKSVIIGENARHVLLSSNLGAKGRASVLPQVRLCFLDFKWRLAV